METIKDNYIIVNVIKKDSDLRRPELHSSPDNTLHCTVYTQHKLLLAKAK